MEASWLKKDRNNFSITKVIIIVFMIAMLISISIIGYLVFSSWFFSAQQTIRVTLMLTALLLLLFSFIIYTIIIKKLFGRTEELQDAIITLDENKNQLQLILDTVVEAIYGIDIHGNLTFCNLNGLKMLGYNHQEELLGKNMHQQIHHTLRDKTPFPINDCKLMQAIINEKGIHGDDVFWRADGISFEVEYYSFPQVKDSKIIGAVITFMDISDRKRKEKEIQHLNNYDILTGLYNRRFFEEHRSQIDNLDNLPLSVIFADINGLKLTNDIFGHTAGDELIKKTAKILQLACRQNDIVARVGGDEFIILLPKTTREDAEKIVVRIKSGFVDTFVRAIKCSISIGLDTKQSTEQLLEEIMSNAEDAMYKDKALSCKPANKEIINTIINILHSKNYREKQHSINVSKLCIEIGRALHLNETEVNKLGRAGYLHDIGKIVLEDILLTGDSMDEDGNEAIRKHVGAGYRILNLFDSTLDLAEYVYSHHERWDGTGYPRRLKDVEIPLLSRIISVAEAYDCLLHREEAQSEGRGDIAIATIKKGAETQFDPHIVKILAQIIEEDRDASRTDTKKYAKDYI